MIHFRLDPRPGSGLSPARRPGPTSRTLGLLRPGDQLPPVREVVTQIAINPNTVHRAYRTWRPRGSSRDNRDADLRLGGACSSNDAERQAELHKELVAWLDKAARRDGRRRDSRPRRALYAN